MVNDRELLEMAAKAAGYKGQWDKDWWAMCDGENHWDPLRHNGQALRLVVKLGIALDRTTNRCLAWVNGWSYPGVCKEFYKNDPYAATRRAIVRAAAEIGKAA